MDTVVYSPNSSVGHPLKLLLSIARDFKKGWHLGKSLMLRDIKARYRQTFLGFFWAFTPAISTVIVFVGLKESKVLSPTGVETIPVSYALFVFGGTLIWETFIGSLMAPLGKVSSSKALMPKINFPREALLIAALGQMLFTTSLKLLVFLGAFVVLEGVLPLHALAFPVLLLIPVLTGFAFGLYLVPLGLLYTDVTNAVSACTRFLFFVTPVAYPLTTQGLFGKLMYYNPLTYLVDPIRAFVIGMEASFSITTVVVLVSFIALCFGLIFYKLSMPIIIERLKA
jgi:lipopolysaccharide transport system permease protein